VLQCFAVCCSVSSVLQCVVVFYLCSKVLHDCVAVCRSVLQCVVVCGRVWQGVAVFSIYLQLQFLVFFSRSIASVFQCVAVCSSVLQCEAV